MNIEKAKRIQGIQCTTNHERAMADIGALWQRAGSEGVLQPGPAAWAVYHDYQLADGGYSVTVTVGQEVPEGTSLPEGRVEVELPAQTCHCIETDGQIPSVQKAWADLWARWPDGGPRSFVADAERWRMGPNGVPSSAEIFVGVRS